MTDAEFDAWLDSTEPDSCRLRPTNPTAPMEPWNHGPHNQLLAAAAEESTDERDCLLNKARHNP